MKLPRDDDDFRGDERFEEDEQAFFNSTGGSAASSKPNPIIDCCATSVAYIQFFWIFRRLECILTLILFTSVTLAVTGVIETYEHRKHDFRKHGFSHSYEDIKSPLELKLGDISHWCLDGSDDTCPQCDDPTHPISRGEYNGWKTAFVRNIHLSNDYVKRGATPDVIFLGDSLIEATMGTLMGIPGLDKTAASDELDRIKSHYDLHFSKEGGAGKYNALRLGIAGDTSPNLFWRIKQNEMKNLSPQVYWLSIGRNDLFRTKCSEEVTLMGIIRVIEELVAKDDGATIVINSLLPTGNGKSMQLGGPYSHNDMWKSIELVNSRLKKFAQKHHHIVFYDADTVFVEAKHKKTYVKKGLYADRVHPNYEGYKELAAGQLEFLDALMQKRAKASQGSGTSPNSNMGGHDGNMNQATGEYEGDDYYGYLNLFGDDDTFLNDYALYGDDDFDDDI